MLLKEYRQKRDFRKTPEPHGRVRKQSGRRFLVQKHAARRLHYDFRLELDGVLKSWAVPKGPSFDPRVKSLAVQVEDHPLEYATFEGVIPLGEYGGGTVMLWDQGTWEPEGDPEQSLRRGKLKFRLHGHKLNGAWHLIQMHGASSDSGKNWLLLKVDDEAAQSMRRKDILADANSVVTGRSMDEIARAQGSVWSSRDKPRVRRKTPATSRKTESNSEATTDSDQTAGLNLAALKGAVRRQPPESFAPQLATLVTAAPQGDDWLHELKYDGYRILCRIVDGRSKLITRRGNDWSSRFPTVVDAARRLGLHNSILDGEVVVLRKDGTSDFQALQNLVKRGRDDDVVYFVFDLPYYEGYDLTRVPLLDRKSVLAHVFETQSPPAVMRMSDHIVGQGPDVAQRACRHGLEGIVSKRSDSTYEQRRSRNWVKFKCLRRQEFVIGGWTDPSGARQAFGALLLGAYEGADLKYCGRVGTGFTDQSLLELRRQFDKLATRETPFVNPPTGAAARSVHWLIPKLVAEVEFHAWTEDGILRQSSFKGLREDKNPHDITREHAVPLGASNSLPIRSVSTASRTRQAPTTVAGVRLTHPDRVIYEEQGLTKLDLARYYETIADWILPHVAQRPLTLVRCPRGRSHDCFYQKHVMVGLPDAVEGVEIDEAESRNLYVSIKDLPGLISLVQFGAMEFHPWGSRTDDVERPDRIVIDLDPGEGVEWAAVVKAARDLHDRLDDLGFVSFLRTTGGKGLHAVVPLVRRSSWDDVKAFAKGLADAMARDAPETYVATASKSQRSGRIYVDYLRNARGATSIASYSTRARRGAPVATPLQWSELSAKLETNPFNVKTVPRRLATLDEDPWAGFIEVRQALSKSAIRDVSRK